MFAGIVYLLAWRKGVKLNHRESPTVGGQIVSNFVNSIESTLEIVQSENIFRYTTLSYAYVPEPGVWNIVWLPVH